MGKGTAKTGFCSKMTKDKNFPKTSQKVLGPRLIMMPPLYLVTPDPESHTEAVKALCLMGGMRGERSLKKEPPFARKACARQALFFARAGLGSSQIYRRRR